MIPSMVASTYSLSKSRCVLRFYEDHRPYEAQGKAFGVTAGKSACCSELEFEGELDRTRAADLVQGIEAAVGAAGAEATGKRLRRLAELRAGQHVVGAAEVWVVEDVEELGSETQAEFLGNVKLPLQREIRLPCPEAPQYIAPEIALLPYGRCGKGRIIENLAAGILRPIKHKRYSWVYVRTGTKGNAIRKENPGNNVNGGRRSGQNKAGK